MAYLTGDDAAFVAGLELHIDGGYTGRCFACRGLTAVKAIVASDG